MGVLKKKEERTETVTIRIPSSVKAEIDQLRDRAEATGFDLNATMSESLTRLVRQVREELEGSQRPTLEAIAQEQRTSMV